MPQTDRFLRPLASFRMPRRLVTAWCAGALGITVLGACSRGDAETSEGGGRTASSGEVAEWTPAALESVRGVPVAAVRSAIERRLREGRPTPIAADQWRHARALYARFGEGPLWLDADGTNAARTTALLRALVDADRDALRLDAYPLPELVRAVSAIRAGQPTAEQLAEADVLLTSAYAALGEDLLTGQVDPRTVSQDWNIDPEEEAVDSALVRSLREPAVDRAIARMRPEAPDYEPLRKALAQYRELAGRGGWRPVPAGRALKPGEADAAPRLEALRARLAAEGLLSEAGVAAAPTPAAQVPVANAVGGDSAAGTRRAAGRARAPRARRAGEAAYDATLAGAVATYQARHAIVVDSVLGEETVRSMNLPATYRLAQVAANLERHRWMPRALGARHIVVNVPAFHLEAYENGRRAMDMKVIVGEEYEDRKTAVFSDTLTTVVFRPYWFVTDDIANKELWPKIRADPTYMEKNRLETFREGGQTRLRQLPGDSNSLGLVKFLFPNEFNIYLHDTPSRELFGKDVRAFSHGCIRVEKPAELAQWVLGWPADSVQRAMQTEPDNKEVKVPRRVPVYITYFTAYLQDGQLRFGNDLYDRDAEMVKAMRADAGQTPASVEAVRALRELVKE
jgi:murein L,D-transpeptidase YcbB/YkuD